MRRVASSPSCGDDIRGRTGSARAAVLSPTDPKPSWRRRNPNGGGRKNAIEINAAGRRGSSEDDLPLPLNRAPDLGDGRGLNPPPDEHRPAAKSSIAH